MLRRRRPPKSSDVWWKRSCKPVLFRISGSHPARRAMEASRSFPAISQPALNVALHSASSSFVRRITRVPGDDQRQYGEAARAVLLSVTEGEDKPSKCPSIFHTADAAIITKMDLAQAVEFDAAAAHRNIDAVRPAIPTFESSVKTETGLNEILTWINLTVHFETPGAAAPAWGTVEGLTPGARRRDREMTVAAASKRTLSFSS
jgi:hypothetical protein